MQTRRAAFAILRRLALHDFSSIPSRLPKWSKPASRHLHSSRALRSLEPSQAPFQIPRPRPTPKTKNLESTGSKDQPAYEMTFTCKPCLTRSTHRVSKQGYHRGSVLITCPECKNRHVISDHLNIFGDKKMTIEDLIREKGQLVKKGSLSEDGDIEIWADGTTTPRVKPDEEKET